MLGVDSVSIELNPFLADLARAKLTPLSPSAVLKDCHTLISRTKIVKGDYKPPSGAPSTLVEPGYNERYIFSRDAFAAARALVRESRKLPEGHARLARVLLGSVLVENSNIVVNGKGRRYRKNWMARPRGARNIFESFESAVEVATEDLSSFSDVRRTTHIVHNADARVQLRRLRKADVAIFSPPYPNSSDYTDVYNLELWVLGYFTASIDNRRLRAQTLRSHVQYKWNQGGSDHQSMRLKDTVHALRQKQDDLWNKNIPEMISLYFDDLFVVFRELKRTLAIGCHATVAIGDSQYAGVLINAAGILSEVVEPLGFRVVTSAPIRSMRTSAQHGGRFELAETAITFERVT